MLPLAHDMETDADASKGVRSFYDTDAPLRAQFCYIMFGAFWLTANLLPAILLTFLVLLYKGCVSGFWLSVFAGAIALDFVVPIQDGSKPNLSSCWWFWRLWAQGAAAYFPGKSIMLCKSLDNNRTYILAAWPHGLFGGFNHLCFVNFHQHYGMHVLPVGATALLYCPFLRRVVSAIGFVDAGKKPMTKALQPGQKPYPYNVLHLVVGGIQEMFYGNAGKEQIIISKRKGFIKLAMETGAGIIPSYTFGANNCYWRPFGPQSILAKLSKILQISLVPWCGRWYVPFGFIPFKTPLLTVIGDVFEVPHNTNPSSEDLDKVHAQFCIVLRKLFDDHRTDYVAMGGVDKSWLTQSLKFEDER